MAHDEAAASELCDERGGGRDAEVDADPRRIDAEIRDDRRRNHRGQRTAERDEGLLQEHRPEGEEEVIHEVLVAAPPQNIPLRRGYIGEHDCQAHEKSGADPAFLLKMRKILFAV